jgi:hypothetical protein
VADRTWYGTAYGPIRYAAPLRPSCRDGLDIRRSQTGLVFGLPGQFGGSACGTPTAVATAVWRSALNTPGVMYAALSSSSVTTDARAFDGLPTGRNLKPDSDRVRH